MNEEEKTQLRKKFIDVYFSKQSNWDGEDKISDGKSREIDRHVYARYEEFKWHFLPWIKRKCVLEGASVLEIGCGTGSSAAALAPHVKRVVGYDIQAAAVEAANIRFASMALDNAEAVHNPADKSVAYIDDAHPDGSIDMVLIYAVLEHQTVEERLHTLEMCWRKLAPGGYLVIGETPNRLTYFDYHTSRMSFFHLLPLDLQVRYFANSNREEYVAHLEGVGSENTDELKEALVRWGQSVSYHEFEIALGKSIHGKVIASGYDPEMVKLRPYRVEEKYLVGYLRELGFKINVAFSRYYHDIIFQKRDELKYNTNFDALNLE